MPTQESIARCRERGLVGLGDFGDRTVGTQAARRLAERFGRLDRIMTAGATELAGIPGVGPEIAASVVRFFGDAGNRRLCRRLQVCGVRAVERHVGPSIGPLGGKTLVHCIVFYDEKDSADFQEAMQLILSAATKAPSPTI